MKTLDQLRLIVDQLKQLNTNLQALTKEISEARTKKS
jgi:hypothetical protein